MEFIAPIPFAEAVKKLGSQSVVGSTFSSSEWRDVPLELRDNAFFSSRIESAQFLQRAQDALGDFIAGNRQTLDDGQTMLATGSRAAFVSQMQDFLTRNGVQRTTGGLTDITSEARLGLIFDVKTQQAQDFGYWLQGMNPALLDEFPAMRFIRVMDVQEPRLAHAPHEDQVYLKTDPIWWLVINKDFGVPWGPWGWGCGHDVEDVDRDEAESLHLLRPGQKVSVPAGMKKFMSLNRNLQASTKNLAPELVDKLKKEFGERVVIEGERIRWLGQPGADIGDPVTSQDKTALVKYTSPQGSSDTINLALLKSGAAADVEIQKQADELSTALAKLAVYNGEVYRGVALTEAELTAAAQRYLPGNVIKETYFVSTTTDRALAAPGSLRFEIRSKSGKLISGYSRLPAEQEVLFDQHTQFLVLAVQRHGGALHIILEEL